jgi:pyridoxamine 5'-phosphate oxidase
MTDLDARLATPRPDSDPYALFAAWYAVAAAGIPKNPESMYLATATPDGRPSLRTVLLKGIVDGGFRFYTHLDSRKGEELALNPWAALLFHWPSLERQVRLEGPVRPVPAEDADVYFASRPRGSQLSALVSPQSHEVTRLELESRRREAEARLAGQPVPRPERWGGLALFPELFELWVASPDRFHERHVYRRQGHGWHYTQLAP